MKHNNVLPNAHFHKAWQRFVKTWFDQPARKEKRRSLRALKAAAVAPRPLNLLRPVVRGQTQRYNGKVRAGRGFTLDELKAAKISKKAAQSIGIVVDHRRKNRSEDSLALNVNRLKAYKAKLVIFPRKPSSQRVKKGDSTKEELKTARQDISSHVLPILDPNQRVKSRQIQKAEKTTSVTKTLRKALTDSKRWGARIKRREEKDAEKAGKAKKAGKEEAAGGDDE
jgi:large subunit ribosomal protein L13e